MYIILYLIFLFSFDVTSGIIFHLNDTEYDKLPTLFELENYDVCMRDPGAVYCVASLTLHGGPDNKIYNLIQEYSQHTMKHYNYTKIDRGICVTKTCGKHIINNTDSDDFYTDVEECLNNEIKEKYNLESRLNRLNCDRKEEVVRKDTLDYIVAAVVVVLCAAVIAGSYYDSKHIEVDGEDRKVGMGGQILKCFSIRRNMKNLTFVGEKQFNDLNGLHGVRAISQEVVIFIHAVPLLCQFVRDTHTYEKAYDDKLFRMIFTLTSIVQIFFLISGFLLTYLLELNSEKHTAASRSIPKIIFQRWWRLAPSVAFVLLVVSTWFRYLGSGPLWKYFVTNAASAQCRKYFWINIFFLNNLFKDDICNFQSWHVAADMQLFIFSVIVHFAIRNRSLRFKIGVLGFFLIIGIVGPIAHVWLQDLDGFFMLKPEVYRTLRDDTLEKYHKLTHSNITSFVFGMANGYFVHYLKQKKVLLPNFKVGNVLCWLTIPMYIGVFYVSSLFFIDVEKHSLLYRILFASCHRVFVGLLFSIWILGAVLQFNGCSRALMEWRWWIIPSKLTYGVYLIHTEVINYLFGSKTEVTLVSYQNFFFVLIGIVVVSHVLSLILFLLVESPSSQLIKLFMGDKTSKSKKET